MSRAQIIAGMEKPLQQKMGRVQGFKEENALKDGEQEMERRVWDRWLMNALKVVDSRGRIVMENCRSINGKSSQIGGQK